jgi:hypothetical protein
MPKSKNRKEHKSKVHKRNSKKEQDKKDVERRRANYINQLIEKEQENGVFDNVEPYDEIDNDKESDGGQEQKPLT